MPAPWEELPGAAIKVRGSVTAFKGPSLRQGWAVQPGTCPAGRRYPDSAAPTHSAQPCNEWAEAQSSDNPTAPSDLQPLLRLPASHLPAANPLRSDTPIHPPLSPHLLSATTSQGISELLAIDDFKAARLTCQAWLQVIVVFCRGEGRGWYTVWYGRTPG